MLLKAFAIVLLLSTLTLVESIEYRFDYNIGSDQVNIRIESRSNTTDSRLEYNIRGTESNNNRIEARYFSNVDSAESAFRFRITVDRLVEYATDSTVLNTYHLNNFSNFEVLETANNASKTLRLQTQDGVYALIIKVNTDSLMGNSSVQVLPENIKLDVEINYATLAAWGWFQTAQTHVALRAIVDDVETVQKQHENDNSTTTNSLQLSTNAAQQSGFFSWVNYVDCLNGATAAQIQVQSSSLMEHNSTQNGTNSGSSSYAIYFTFVGGNADTLGKCVWDPVIGVSSNQVTTPDATSPTAANPTAGTPAATNVPAANNVPASSPARRSGANILAFSIVMLMGLFVSLL